TKPKTAKAKVDSKSKEAATVVEAEEIVDDVKEVETHEEAKKVVETGGDDLTKVEGIGPKISEILSTAGFPTFATLAEADVEKLREVLAEAGSRYKSHDPETWPAQAKLAAEGKWDELKKWQDELDGGRAKE
ncbi:MAG: 30S ribosomal protein S2, partial [Ignavibacteriae bacterium]|nr:30S ribosomal protein S2 [Ignavibacteriota bacterium]